MCISFDMPTSQIFAFSDRSSSTVADTRSLSASELRDGPTIVRQESHQGKDGTRQYAFLCQGTGSSAHASCMTLIELRQTLVKGVKCRAAPFGVFRSMWAMRLEWRNVRPRATSSAIFLPMPGPPALHVMADTRVPYAAPQI